MPLNDAAMKRKPRLHRVNCPHLRSATANAHSRNVRLISNVHRKKIIAYQIHHGDAAQIRPASAARKWMDDADRKFPYRCLPLMIANQYGWEILSSDDFRATWDGSSRPQGIRIEKLGDECPLHCHSHFGEGILTFQLPFLFRTPKGWNLMVRGPANNPKDGIIALDGIVETDWAPSTFTMNWLFTRACTVEFMRGEPICLFFPIQRGVIESFDGEVVNLKVNPELNGKFCEWSLSRNRFLLGLQNGEPEVIHQGWQKDYIHAAEDKRLCIASFVNKFDQL
jgi:hypothetical protein